MSTATLRLLPLALALIAGSAAAQSSSVTIFGVVDEAVRTANTGGVGHQNSVASGSFSSSRYGFRGQEDLGGGQSASFWLESFLNADTGVTTPQGFQRRSTLSFIDQKWGEIRLGRDYTPTHTNWARFDPFGYVGMGSNQLLILSATGNTPVTAAFGNNPNPVQRANNGISLILPRNDWGIEANVVHNFGEGGVAANDLHKSDGGHLGVNYGPWLVSAATLRTTDLTAPKGFHDAAFGVAYSIPVVRLTAAVRRLSYQPAAQNNYLAAAQIFFGVQEIKLSWNRVNMQGNVGKVIINGDRTDQYAIGYVYNFSKRTRLYATAASMRNKGNARFVVPGALSATANGQGSTGLEIGLNQEF